MTTRIESTRHARLQAFASATTRRLANHVRSQCPGDSVIHAGFCAHPNPGDNAISIAETRLLRIAGKHIARRYSDLAMMASAETIMDCIRSQTGHPAIVLSGGGFLTHLYPDILDACTVLIREFDDRPILIMPQSSNLDESPASLSFVAAVRDHPRIRLLARDRTTFDELKNRTSSDVHLAPDSVLIFGVAPGRFPRRQVPIAVVARQDGEESPGRGPVPAYPVLPWMDEPRAFRDPRVLAARLQHRELITGRGSKLLMWAAALGRTRRALSMVRSARLILADRLHAVILSLVTQTPVVAIDNSYGKIHGAIDTWDLTELGRLRMADTFQEAEEVGKALIGNAHQSGSDS